MLMPSRHQEKILYFLIFVLSNIMPSIANYLNIIDAKEHYHSVQFKQSCMTLCNPVDCSTTCSSVHHQLPEPAQKHVHPVGDAVQPSHPLSPLLLLPSIFPSIRVFSNESVLQIRWPKYWSFSFNISLSNEHSGLISLRMD